MSKGAKSHGHNILMDKNGFQSVAQGSKAYESVPFAQ